MKSRSTCISEQLWFEAIEKAEDRTLKLKNILKCDSWHYYGQGVPTAPCNAQLWRKYVGSEHDEYTCYFRHWFKMSEGKASPRPFSHLAIMPLVRSCVWQTLLAEFVTKELAGKDAVRIRVEDELEHYSNLKSSELIRKLGMLAQDFFGLVKNHLNSKDKPLNRAGLAGAEKMVIDLPGLDYRSKRKGWSNRKLRQELAQKIVDAGIGEIPTRKEQEAFIWKWLSIDNDLKQSAPKAILKLLLNYSDSDGVCIIKPWSKSELSEIRKEARERGAMAKTLRKIDEISAKLASGDKLTEGEKSFYYHHRKSFAQTKKVVANQKSICKEIIYTKSILICHKQKKSKIKNPTLSSIANVMADRFDLPQEKIPKEKQS